MKINNLFSLSMKVGAASALTVGMLAMFNNCSFVGSNPVQLNGGANSGSSVTPPTNVPPASVGVPSGTAPEPQFPVTAGKANAAIVTYNNALHSMVSLAGTGTPSAAATTYWNANKNTFSLDGNPESVNAPMYLALVNLAGFVCDDLITKEAALGAATRRIFNSIDFAAVRQTAFSTAAVDDLTTRMSRAFWGRAMTSAEKTVILNNLAAANQGAANSAVETRKSALLLCAGMLSAVSAIEM